MWRAGGRVVTDVMSVVACSAGGSIGGPAVALMQLIGLACVCVVNRLPGVLPVGLAHLKHHILAIFSVRHEINKAFVGSFPLFNNDT